MFQYLLVTGFKAINVTSTSLKYLYTADYLRNVFTPLILNDTNAVIAPHARYLLLSVSLAMMFALPFSIKAQERLVGKVVGISDGDTMTILQGTQSIKVRLTEIDAPEKKQPYGKQSKASLSALCFDQTVSYVVKGNDRYGRTLARVWCQGEDANAYQIENGMAWVFDRYVTDKSLYDLQSHAQAKQRGLWADVQPIPPWEWRHLVK